MCIFLHFVPEFSGFGQLHVLLIRAGLLSFLLNEVDVAELAQRVEHRRGKGRIFISVFVLIGCCFFDKSEVNQLDLVVGIIKVLLILKRDRCSIRLDEWEGRTGAGDPQEGLLSIGDYWAEPAEVLLHWLGVF